MADPFNLYQCGDYMVRPSRPSAFEYTAAELWVRFWYEDYFRSKFRIPQVVTWQLARFLEILLEEARDPVVELTMKTLERDFRNPLLPSQILEFRKLLAGPSSDEDLRKFVKRISPGGSLKPDMLGISAHRVLEFDAVEVGTVKTADETYKELQHKLGVIQSTIVPQLKLTMPALAMKYAGGRGMGINVPQDFSVRASAFRLEPWQRVLPLPVQISGTGNVSYADWICYHPSSTYHAPDTPAERRGLQGTDGLIIYHVHRARVPRLPKRVRDEVDKALRQWNWKHGRSFELNPALAFALKDTRSEWDPEHKEMFMLGLAGTAAVLLVVAFAFVAIEAGVVGAVGGALAGGGSAAGGSQAGAAATGGLIRLVSNPALLRIFIADLAQLAQKLWPAAVAGSQTLVTQR